MVDSQRSMEAILRIFGAIWLWRWADRRDAQVRHDEFVTAVALEGAEAHRVAWEAYVSEWDTDEHL